MSFRPISSSFHLRFARRICGQNDGRNKIINWENGELSIRATEEFIFHNQFSRFGWCLSRHSSFICRSFVRTNYAVCMGVAVHYTLSHWTFMDYRFTLIRKNTNDLLHRQRWSRRDGQDDENEIWTSIKLSIQCSNQETKIAFAQFHNVETIKTFLICTTFFAFHQKRLMYDFLLVYFSLIYS